MKNLLICICTLAIATSGYVIQSNESAQTGKTGNTIEILHWRHDFSLNHVKPTSPSREHNNLPINQLQIIKISSSMYVSF